MRNILEHRCLKWVGMTYLDIWNTCCGQKKGWASNWESTWQFDSRPLKVRNHPDFLAFRWRATYRWKDLDEGYTNFFILHLHWRSAHKVISPQSHGSPNRENFRTLTWKFRDKMPFGCGPRGEAQSIL